MNVKIEQAISDEPAIEMRQSTRSLMREFFAAWLRGFGKGENPRFKNIDDNLVFCNMIGDGEKPLLEIENGQTRQWLTSEELITLRNEQNTAPLTHEQLFDFFSFLFGGRAPTIGNLGLSGWSSLRDEVLASDPQASVSKVNAILTAIDAHHTTLEYIVGSRVGVGVDHMESIPCTHNGKNSSINLQGEMSWRRNVMVIWHRIRNMRNDTEPSPFREDGNRSIGPICDVTVGYQVGGEVHFRRLNAVVLLMAYHGLSETANAQADSDQVYITIREYLERMLPKDEDTRIMWQKEEAENFQIFFQIKAGLDELLKSRRRRIYQELLMLDESGFLDDCMKAIEAYESTPQG